MHLLQSANGIVVFYCGPCGTSQESVAIPRDSFDVMITYRNGVAAHDGASVLYVVRFGHFNSNRTSHGQFRLDGLVWRGNTPGPTPLIKKVGGPTLEQFGRHMSTWKNQNDLRHSDDGLEKYQESSSPGQGNARLCAYEQGASVALGFLNVVGIAIAHLGADVEVTIVQTDNSIGKLDSASLGICRQNHLGSSKTIYVYQGNVYTRRR